MYLWQSFMCTLALVQVKLAAALTPYACVDNQGDGDLSVGCLSALRHDGEVASTVLYEDSFSKIWNLTLLPGEMSSMHLHDHDYSFVVEETSKLALWNDKGELLLVFQPTGRNSFTLKGDSLMPVIGSELPRLPRTHAVKNIGEGIFRETLIENKAMTNKTVDQIRNLKLALSTDTNSPDGEPSHATAKGLRSICPKHLKKWRTTDAHAASIMAASTVSYALGTATGFATTRLFLRNRPFGGDEDTRHQFAPLGIIQDQLQGEAVGG